MKKKSMRPLSVVARTACSMYGWFMMAFGAYVIVHGDVTPGGGFQGGVIVASAAILLYLGYGYSITRRVISSETLRVGEAVGASLYVFLGLAGLVAGANFCRNIFFITFLYSGWS